MPWNTLDLKGKTYGRLTVVERAPNRGGKTAWACVCDCGNRTTVRTSSLRSGRTQSCGCVQRELQQRGNVKHKQHGARLYEIWKAMRQRCSNPNASGYENYGARGICVCPEWGEFAAFHAWAMANGYRDDLSIERIDNDGNYEPGNCEWITRAEQGRNTSRVQKIGLNGEKKTVMQWAEQAGVPYTTVRSRLNRGLNIEQALLPTSGAAL